MPKNSEESKTITRKRESKKKSEGGISIRDVAIIFDLSEKQMRNYKMAGIIRPVEKRGMQDLYDLETIVKVSQACKKCRSKGLTLTQIAEKMKVLYEEEELEPKLGTNPKDKKLRIQKITESLEKAVQDLSKAVAML